MIIELKDEEIKKGAAPGYLEELAGRLFRERIHTLPVQDGLLTVTLDDRPVGAVAENGDMYQRRSDLDTPEAKDLYFRVLDISREVSGYRKEMERAPVLVAEGLNEPYKLLAEYKGIAASGVFQIILPGALAVGAGLLSLYGIMENIQKLFGVLSGFVKKGNILRIPHVRRSTGGVHNHGTAVAA